MREADPDEFVRGREGKVSGRLWGKSLDKCNTRLNLLLLGFGRILPVLRWIGGVRGSFSVSYTYYGWRATAPAKPMVSQLLPIKEHLVGISRNRLSVSLMVRGRFDLARRNMETWSDSVVLVGDGAPKISSARVVAEMPPTSAHRPQ